MVMKDWQIRRVENAHEMQRKSSLSLTRPDPHVFGPFLPGISGFPAF
jgi:hypothetical protein